MADIDRVFRQFLDRLQCTHREFLTQSLRFVNRQNPDFYNAYRWPKRDETGPEQRSEPDLMVPLEDRAEEITSALIELKIAPRYLVEGQVRHRGTEWDSADSLAAHAYKCLQQYAEQKATSRIHREFLTCMIAMSYSCTMDALHRVGLGNTRASINARRKYFDLRKEVKKSTHDRLMRIGRRSLDLVTVFGSFSALAILGPYRLRTIDKMGADLFEQFIALLRDEVQIRRPVTMTIGEIFVDRRLVTLYGETLPPQLRPFLAAIPTPDDPNRPGNSYGKPSRPGNGSGNLNRPGSTDDSGNPENLRRLVRRRGTNRTPIRRVRPRRN